MFAFLLVLCYDLQGNMITGDILKEIVYVALSGGVDSAAAAIILKQRGYDVRGVTLRLKPDNLADGDIADAKEVAETLNIPLEVLDKRRDFKKITDSFCTAYLNGLTPNPCVLCNPTIKFGKLVEHALKNGAKYLATGHYSNIVEDNGIFYIKRNPSNKDQSYFLCRLNQHLLSHVMFPLSDFTKEETRALAESEHINVAHKKDSQEVCFIPDNDYISFIEKEFSPKSVSGDFLSSDGKKLGTHSGIYKYTVGQRKGLGAFGKPMYVLSIDAVGNTVTIGDNAELFKKTIAVNDLNFLAGTPPAVKFECEVKIRCAAKPAKAIAEIADGKATVEFFEPQRAAAPGQTAAIYINDILIGGGTICNL